MATVAVLKIHLRKGKETFKNIVRGRAFRLRELVYLYPLKDPNLYVEYYLSLFVFLICCILALHVYVVTIVLHYVRHKALKW